MPDSKQFSRQSIAELSLLAGEITGIAQSAGKINGVESVLIMKTGLIKWAERIADVVNREL
jgi:hypothetical protein